MRLQLNTKFNPFTYAEMVAPLIQYSEAYDKAQEQYSNLATQTALLENIARTDPEVYRQFQDYQSQLDDAVTSFSQGMTSENRSALLGLNKMYASKIAPISSAYTQLEALRKEQQAMRDKDPSTYFDVDANNLTLSQVMQNPMIRHTKAISGDYLQKQVEDVVKNLKNKTFTEEELENFSLPFQYRLKSKKGLDIEDIRDMIYMAQNGDRDADHFLDSILNPVLDSAGVWEIQNEEARNRLLGKAALGLYAGVGEDEIKYLSDDYSREMALMQYKSSLDAEKKSKEQKEYDSNITHLDASIIAPEHMSAMTNLYDRLNKGLATDTSVTDSTLSPTGRRLEGKVTGGYFGDYNNYNPMAVRDELDNRLKKSGLAPGDSSRRHYDPSGQSFKKMKSIEEEVKKKYGVSDIISPEDYNILQTLGYSSKDKVSDFADMEDRINSQAQAYRISSTNQSNYDVIGEKTLNTMRALYQDNWSGLYEYDKGKAGKLADKDILEEAKNINNIGYSIQEPDKLYIAIDGKSYFINPAYLDAETADIIKEGQQLLSQAKTNEQKSKIQDITTMKLRRKINDYNQTKGKTKS